MKTTMKKTVAYLLAMLLIFQMIPAFAGETESNTLSPIKSYRDKLEVTAVTKVLAVGMSVTLEVNEGYNKINWISDDPSIATVDENGVVTALADGQVRITAEEATYRDSITIRVVENSTEPESQDEPEAQDESEHQDETEAQGEPETQSEPEAQNEQEANHTATDKKMIVLINGTKDKITYDGEIHVTSFNAYSDDEDFDEGKVKLYSSDNLAAGKDCNVYQDNLTKDDFYYEGNDNVEFVVSNGWLQIKPLSVTVKANDATQEEGENPEFTAEVTGLLEGEDPDLIQYTFELYVSGDITYIMPVCEPVQGNYKVTAQPGILTLKEDIYRAIKLSSNWPEGEPAYEGDMITMTAELIGFENVNYTLQWQHSTDMQEWINEPGANGTTFTYELNETTCEYTWRVVAKY